MTRQQFTFVFLLFLSSLTNAKSVKYKGSTDDYFVPDYLQFDNITYKKNIKTVLLSPESAELSFPIIALNSGERLELSFDDLDADRKTYNYTLIHCDANWNPTNWIYTEYIEGYHDEQITENKYSFNSIQRYTHYTLLFPSEGLRLKKSGNYILKVYQDYDESNVVLTRRFMIYDKQVEVFGTATAATIINDRYTKQQVNFTISNPAFEMNDPYQSLKVTVLQNQRYDNAITKLKPTYTKLGQLVYDYAEGNVFNAGNEFRYFEDRNFRAPNEKVNKYVFDEKKQNNVYLIPEEKRSYKRYSTQTDLNGKYVIRTLEGNDGASESDYAFVHFYLPEEEELKDADVYVFGALSDWKFLPEFKMKYDTAFAAYTAAPYLKQGYYNYEYMVVKSNQNTANESVYEGSHFETENDYYIFVYYQSFGTYYDQLIGYQRLNTRGK